MKSGFKVDRSKQKLKKPVGKLLRGCLKYFKNVPKVKIFTIKPILSINFRTFFRKKLKL